jgi:hypothetical protein
MNLSLLFPAGLIALAALLVPLLLHLQRQPESRPTDFAALRWLSEKLRPRQRLQLEERLLLLLRLLLVACLALLFAQPVWTARGEGRPWVLVSPQIDGAQLKAIQSATPASLSSYPPDAQWHWLAPGFPDFDTPTPTAQQPTASLLRDADAQLPPKAALIVLVPEVIDGLDGERPRLARAVDWRALPGPPAATARVASKPGLLAIRFAPGHEGGLRYLRAAAQANGHALDVGALDQPIPAAAQALVWLGTGPLPEAARAWAEQGGTVLLAAQTTLPGAALGAPLWRDDQGTALLRASTLGRGRVLQWQAELQPAALPALLEPSFAARLESWLQAPAAAPARAAAQALRPQLGARSYPRIPVTLDPMLAWLALMLFAFERWFATRAARGAAA